MGFDPPTGPSTIESDNDLDSRYLTGTEYGSKSTLWYPELNSVPDSPSLSFKHMVVDIVRIDEGLVKYRDTFPGGPLAFFEDVAQNTFVIKNAIYTLQTLLGDGVVVRRDHSITPGIAFADPRLDLSLLCRMAIDLDHRPPFNALVQCSK